MFQSGLPRTCSIDKKDAMAQQYRFEFVSTGTAGDHGQVQRIYVFHASAQTIDAASVRWTIQLFDSPEKRPKPTTVVPSMVERHDLGEFAITELRSDFMAQGAVTIGDQTCSPYK
jgi:hypothetical protein